MHPLAPIFSLLTSVILLSRLVQCVFGLAATVMASNIDLWSLIDFSQTSLYIALASITFNPTWWNVVAQNGEACYFGHLVVDPTELTITRVART